ncbi:sulfotransferase [uncultured Erythrobacter sp.]|uniref:sulfotransferase family protein n=1 Tax=uncultured Erythrobacter sp. TaxID=263913 RepID=UPI002632EBB3|nr:sulfotransferase [uncultured Erythrobacter sp.]
MARAWEKGWLPPPVLDAEAIWAQAAKRFEAEAERGGRSGEDVADFRERFARLVQAVREEADLNALGQAMAWGQLSRVVANRLKLGALWNRQPELLETTLAPPIIVIGHMRSGTTRIHKLLAADPAHSHTRYCDAYHPVPGLAGISLLKGALELAMLGALNPWMQAIHPMASGEVEEELAWISAGLHHSIYETQWHIPSYSVWSEARDSACVYREFARILKSDAAHRGIADKPRVMKVPAFAEDLRTLITLFPDARLVLAERDLEAVHRSAVSLCANQMAVQTDSCDLTRIEALWRHKIDLREGRMAEALASWKGPITQLHYDALGEDSEREIRRAYAELSLDLTPHALAAMRAQMAKAQEGRHRAHSEQLALFERDGV